MAKVSAGILVYGKNGNAHEFLLVHPGGPFWAKKDEGAWSIPKGEIEEGEGLLSAARREFEEEVGQPAPTGDFLPLGWEKCRNGKTVHVWAVQGNLDVKEVRSSTFEMEWPPHSGKKQEFPEVDKAEFFGFEEAKKKINKDQIPFLERLMGEIKRS